MRNRLKKAAACLPLLLALAGCSQAPKEVNSRPVHEVPFEQPLVLIPETGQDFYFNLKHNKRKYPPLFNDKILRAHCSNMMEQTYLLANAVSCHKDGKIKKIYEELTLLRAFTDPQAEQCRELFKAYKHFKKPMPYENIKSIEFTPEKIPQYCADNQIKIHKAMDKTFEFMLIRAKEKAVEENISEDEMMKEAHDYIFKTKQEIHNIND